MALMGNLAIPILTIREAITSAVDIIVHCDMLRDGSRRVSKVTEVIGMEGDVVVMQDLFEFQTVNWEGGKMTGQFTATGTIPKFLDHIQGISADFPEDLFQAGT